MEALLMAASLIKAGTALLEAIQRAKEQNRELTEAEAKQVLADAKAKDATWRAEWDALLPKP